MQPLVSIIIPTYNRAHLIGETLDSVIAQTYKNWECIVVDDGSTDYTEELLAFYCERDPRIKYHHRPAQKPKGANACRNYGFELSKGDYVNWFDSDDLMQKDKLFIQLEAVLKSSADFCICKMYNWDAKNNVCSIRFKKIFSSEPFYDYVTGGIGFLTQVPLWRSEFLKSNKYNFDEELEAGQEWEFHSRILFSSELYIIVELPLVFLRIHEDNISNQEQSKVLWNYFLARFKVYQNFKNELDLKSRNYFLSYFLWMFKKNLRYSYFKTASKIMVKSILSEKKIPLSIRIKLFIGFFSFRFLGKGNVFIKNTDV